MKSSERIRPKVSWRKCIGWCSVGLYAVASVLLFALAILLWLKQRDALDSPLVQAVIPVFATLCGVVIGFLLTIWRDWRRAADRARKALFAMEAELDYILHGLRVLVNKAVGKDIDRLGKAERVTLDITDIALNITCTIYHAYLEDLQGVQEEIAMAVHGAYKLCEGFPTLVSLGMHLGAPQNSQPGAQRSSPTVSLPGSKIKHMATGIEVALGLLRNEDD